MRGLRTQVKARQKAHENIAYVGYMDQPAEQPITIFATNRRDLAADVAYVINRAKLCKVIFSACVFEKQGQKLSRSQSQGLKYYTHEAK